VCSDPALQNRGRVLSCLSLLNKCITSYALRFLKHHFHARVYLQLSARARRCFGIGTPLVRFIAHGIEEKMALLPNLFYIKGDWFDPRGSATGIKQLDF